MSDVTVKEAPWFSGLKRSEWRSLGAANLGWLFDGFETYALILTAGTVIHEARTRRQARARSRSWSA